MGALGVKLIVDAFNTLAVTASGKRVELSGRLSDLQAQGLADAALLSQLGHMANAQSALAFGKADTAWVPFASSLEQFRELVGEQLTVVSSQHVAGINESVWRARVHAHAPNERINQQNLVAEVTQRFRWAAQGAASQEDEPPVAAPDKADAELGPRKDEGVADRRRRQIFLGACEVIAKKGWANASIRDITRAAKITIPTMYQYISGKEDILYLVTSMCMEEILQHFQAHTQSDKAPLESLVDAIAAYFGYIDKNRRYINLVYSETRSLSEVNRERIFELEKQFIYLWELILIKGNETGVFNIRNTHLAANLIYFLCTAWALRHWSIGIYPEEEVKQHILDMILNGIRVGS